MTVAEYIFSFLQEKGTDTVFMVSGSSAMWLTDALKRKAEITKICNHHEQACVMAADIYSKVTGKVGVAMVTIGPGATNAITGVAEAYVDSSAVFVVSGQANSKLLAYEEATGIRQHGTQSINLRPLVSSITKFFAVIDSPEKTRRIMEEAYHAASTGRKGPVWIDVPVNVQNSQVPSEMEPAEEKYRNILINMEDITKISTMLREAKRPLIFAGQGVKCSSARELLKQLYTKGKIPVVTSRMGIDIIENDCDLFVGRPGAYGNRAAHFALQNADFLLILGCRLSVSSIGYYPQKLAEKAFKVQVDIDALELKKEDVPIDIKINADVKEFLELFIPYVEQKEKMEWATICMKWREKYPAVLPFQREAMPINTYYFTEVLASRASEDAVIVVDTGTVCNVVSQTWKVKREQNYLISGGLSCMGYWAGAIGACYGNNRKRQVIAITGDGSLQMNIQEFATLKQNNIPVKLFVYNNGGYLLIKHNQHNYMNDRFLGVNSESGVYVPNVCEIAKAYGLQHIRVETPEEIERKIIYVLSCDGPVICEVICDDFQDMIPRLSSKVMPDGSLKASDFDDLYPFLPEKELRQNRLYERSEGNEK